ncbi:uncharacterized protein LOC105446884 [Strongylocentrotus purpuratus]|uniref:Uncharacterized protein n=1 Tax=Strongylocentrotus purpuratus TaxID=7668 RepID=A0A7M7NNG1_STRPU|nr:uncharacterized protein LOC105446884 [Strongylocentrotus purpuratus]
MPGSEPKDASTQGPGGSNPSLIPALSSAIVLILIIMVIIAVFVLRRRRFRDPKVTEPVDQEDDDPNLYNNPVYCSKDDGLPIPDLIISTNSHTGSLSQARHPSTYMDNQYEEFEGDRHPVTNADGSASHPDALRDTTAESNTLNSNPYYTLEDPSNQGGNTKAHDEGDYHTYEQAQGPQTSKKPGRINKGQTGTDDVYQELNNTSLSIDPYSSLASPNSGLPKKELHNGGTQGQSDGSAVLDDEEEYNALTFNKSSDITRALKKPISGGENVNNGYGVLDLPEQKDFKVSVNPPQLHNDDVYNTLEEGPQEPMNGKQQATDQSSGYQALKLGQSNIPISHRVLNLKMGSTDDGSTGGYQSLSPGTRGPGPKAGSYEGDQPGDESEYHSYQDPSQMNQDGSARTPTELHVFSSDNYNILNSVKEVGDYHGYQDPSEMNQDGSARTPTEQDVFSSNKYNVLNSGKEVGDYHVYQATDDTGVDEVNYENLDSKMSREDEYSEIDQSQNHAPWTIDNATFEPIYSDEVYSEFQ